MYKSQNKFYYHRNNQLVTDNKILSRINSIRVPPAWVNVWYSCNKNDHIQVYGYDTSGKKQYILSPDWILNSNNQKFNKMKYFFKDLVSFKKKIKLNDFELNKQNLINLLFNLLLDTHIRVGNEKYAEQNNTYGLTTLLQKHLKVDDNNYYISFLGKSKIKHLIKIPEEYNQIITKLKLRDPYKKLFHYSNGKTISAEQLNDYLKEHMGDYTCKDFRTYSANTLFIKFFLKNCKKQNNVKKILIKSIDQSAELLGHSRSISKKSYISNHLLDYCVNQFESACVATTAELVSKIWDPTSASGSGS
uniref:DNA topoisomerase n=1 Tax=viral metagenome TaxID=1070528 RepID=A0A6C0I831_9ZZZZ